MSEIKGFKKLPNIPTGDLREPTSIDWTLQEVHMVEGCWTDMFVEPQNVYLMAQNFDEVKKALFEPLEHQVANTVSSCLKLHPDDTKLTWEDYVTSDLRKFTLSWVPQHHIALFVGGQADGKFQPIRGYEEVIALPVMYKSRAVEPETTHTELDLGNEIYQLSGWSSSNRAWIYRVRR